MRVILRNSSQIQGIVQTVIRVEIQKEAARLQDTEPFPVRLLRIRKRPRQVPGNHNVKAAVRKSGFHGVSHFKPADSPFLPRKLFGSLNHSRSQINTGHLITHAGEKNTEKSGTAADVQHLSLMFFRQITV